MGIRLIRENSNTPNVTNTDDVRMVRYAYGGYNGFVKGRGRELECEVNGNTVTINSGIIVLQGWEVEVDSNGWSMQVSQSDMTKRYYTVYCEVNLTSGAQSSIKSVVNTVNYPTVSAGDDLTKNTNGIARIELYRFTSQSGIITNVQRKIEEIPYSVNVMAEVNQRLDDMGFKEASVENGAISPQDGWADAETSKVKIIKMAKVVVLQELYLGTVSNLKTSYRKLSSNGLQYIVYYISTISGNLFIVPSEFRPKENITVKAKATVTYVSGVGSSAMYFSTTVHINLVIQADGIVKATTTGEIVDSTILDASVAHPAYISCNNVGWELP